MDSLSPVHRVWSIAARTSFAISASLGSHVRCPLATPLLERCRGTVNADSSGTGKRSGKGASRIFCCPYAGRSGTRTLGWVTLEPRASAAASVSTPKYVGSLSNDQ